MTRFSHMPPEAGLGLKPEHYVRALEAVSASVPCDQYVPGWFEVHPQNYFGAGGPPLRWLAAFADQTALSFHSVGLSLGSRSGVHQGELEQLAALCERFDPAMVSDHLSWSGSADNRFPDLLPVPYTCEVLDHFAVQVERVQDRLNRTILIENPSRYLAFVGDEMDEAEFLHALCARSGCGILLDVNNIEVSATNLGLDADAMIDAIDYRLIGEVHLAGHAREEHVEGPLLIDDHGSTVSERTWSLFRRIIERAGPRPTLVEWDTDVPSYPVLCAEAAKADAILQEFRFKPDNCLEVSRELA